MPEGRTRFATPFKPSNSLRMSYGLQKEKVVSYLSIEENDSIRRLAVRHSLPVTEFVRQATLFAMARMD